MVASREQRAAHTKSELGPRVTFVCMRGLRELPAIERSVSPQVWTGRREMAGQMYHWCTNEFAASTFARLFQRSRRPSKRQQLSSPELSMNSIIKTQGCTLNGKWSSTYNKSSSSTSKSTSAEPNCGQQTLTLAARQQLSCRRRRQRRPTASNPSCLAAAIFYLASIALAPAVGATSAATARTAPASAAETQPLSNAQISEQVASGHNHWPQVFPADQKQFAPVEKSTIDLVSSADLPAEFRGSDEDDADLATEAPKEQSKLEKLCLQTSSVLAAVLPAPFGGHKRSILCQFFGHLPMQPNSQRAKHEQQQQKQLPIAGSYEPASSVAVLQQPQQPPISLLANGRHPIQLVLEHQQRQLLIASQQQQQQQQQQKQQQQVVQRMAAQPFNSLQDLKSSASVVDFAYHQKLDPPAGMNKNSARTMTKASEQPAVKFNTPATSSSFKPMAQQPTSSSQLMSTSGWRILNHSFHSSATTPSQPSTVATHPNDKNHSAAATTSTTNTTSTTTLIPPIISTAVSPAYKQASTETSHHSRRPTNTVETSAHDHAKLNETPAKQVVVPTMNVSVHLDAKQQESSASSTTSRSTSVPQLLVMGKPPSFAGNSRQQTDLNQTTSLGKRSEALKTTTTARSPNRKLDQSSDEVRTIEVIAQSSNASSLDSAHGKRLQPFTFTTSTTTLKSAADLHQVQKREELVIASINNLTRIAFGNQLRNTVKVINKLIDQQSDLYGQSKRPASDPMTTAESKPSVANAAGEKPKPTRLIGGKASINQTASATSRSSSKQTTAQPAIMKPTKKAKKSTTADQSRASQQSFVTQTSSTRSQLARTTPPEVWNSHRERRLIAPSKDGSRRVPTTEMRAVSRSLMSDSVTGKATRSSEEFDPILQAATIGDIHRGKARSATTQSKLSTRSVSGTSSLSTVSISPKRKHVTHAPSTNYPWLLLDKNPYHSNSFDVTGGFAPVSQKMTTLDPYQKWATRKEPAAARVSAIKQATTQLNRIDKPETTKLDSLATLKMSLTTTTTSATPPRLASQTRWIPTTAIFHSSTASPSTRGKTSASVAMTTAAITTTTRIPTTTTSSPTSLTSETVSIVPTTTTISPPEISTVSLLPTSKASSSLDVMRDGQESSTRTSMTTTPAQDDLNEAKASETISKYTTHWNEGNELLATTKRLYQKPLPQIVSTGEFFSAETIASWPERYQTMMGQALDDGLRTTPSFETTRRNGESYEASTLGRRASRHKNTATTYADQTTRRSLPTATTMPGITILPANHKLVATTAAETTVTSLNFQTTRLPPVPGPAVAYTLIGPYTEPDTAQQPAISQETVSEGDMNLVNSFPRILGSSTSEIQPPISMSNISSALKPPYLKSLTDDFEEEDHDRIPVNKNQASRKLYEFLMPSTRNVVNAPNPSNQQRFNLSALKFLAQNLLLPTNYYNDSTPFSNQGEEQPSYGNGTIDSSKSVDMLNSSLPSNYYELLLNETSEAVAGNKSSLPGKSILSRAGNLLNDLRQLEHKKAAAILAAIRYQVPSPLVRPWDLASDNHPVISAAQISDRLDVSEPKELLTNSLLLSKAAQTVIKAALAKQRVVPRDELEARLNGNKYIHNQQSMDYSDRRSDSGSVFDHTQPDGAGSAKNEQESDYDVSMAESPTGRPANKDGRNFSRIILDKLIQPTKTKTLADESKNSANPETNNEEDKHDTSSFECAGRQAGFYPDAQSACRTFYHCSNTEHLLTFNCPQQTRFDEKSLKCGPWFEVPCDLGRFRQRRQL